VEKVETVVETLIEERVETVVETVIEEKVETVIEEKVETVVETVVEQVEVLVTAEPDTGPKGTLTVALSTFPNSLDPPQQAERNASNSGGQLFNSLVEVDEKGEVVPSLAESWEVSEDGLEYIFHLREGVTFHNGEPLTADAVIFSVERGRDGGFEYSYNYDKTESMEAIDDLTVKMTLPGPNAFFLKEVWGWSIIPPDYFNEVGQKGFEDHPIGTGPFLFVEWEKGDHITYVANPDYWDEGLPKVENLIFRPIPESATRVAAVQTGEVDIVQRLSSEEAQSLLGVDNVKVIRYPVDRVYYIAFNNLTSGLDQPTMDPNVRIAMNYAVDVDAIIDALFDGFATPVSGYLTPASLGYDGAEPFGYDPDKARELLAEAGYPDGFEMGFACPAGAYTNFEQVCEAVQAFLAEVGIQTELEIMESGQYWDLEAAKELPPLFGDSWSAASGEAYWRLFGALGGWDASYSAWSDPEIDRLLEEILGAVDTQERAALYGELQVYMRENPPFIYLYAPNAFEAINTRVRDYKPQAAENYRLEGTWVVED
jgi:peptide/nickel transport system substrate-binding protein